MTLWQCIYFKYQIKSYLWIYTQSNSSLWCLFYLENENDFRIWRNYPLCRQRYATRLDRIGRHSGSICRWLNVCGCRTHDRSYMTLLLALRDCSAKRIEPNPSIIFLQINMMRQLEHRWGSWKYLLSVFLCFFQLALPTFSPVTFKDAQHAKGNGSKPQDQRENKWHLLKHLLWTS